MARKVAVFTHGGIGTGTNSQGFPLLMQIVNKLAQDFNLTVYSLSAFNEEFKPVGYRAYSVPPALKPALLRWIYLIAIFIIHAPKEKYDVFYSFWGYPTGLVTVLLGKIFRVPSLINILGAETADVPQINYGYLRKPIDRQLVLWTCKSASKLIAVSSYQADALKACGVSRDVQVIPWGVDKECFYPVFQALRLPLKILHVANLNEVKDQETLVRAFHYIHSRIPAQLKIVGPDFLKGKIQALVMSLGLQHAVEFVGFVPHREILKYFHWADAFMLTSLSEGQNNSITEAMMCGILPVGTPVGIMYDIGEVVGVVAACKDYESLGKKVIALYNLPDEWEAKRTAAYHWASHHDLNWTVHQLKQVLNNA